MTRLEGGLPRPVLSSKAAPSIRMEKPSGLFCFSPPGGAAQDVELFPPLGNYLLDFHVFPHSYPVILEQRFPTVSSGSVMSLPTTAGRTAASYPHSQYLRPRLDQSVVVMRRS